MASEYWKGIDIGDRPAFATDPNPAAYEGMTYRQWLIGQALMDAMAHPYAFDVEHVFKSTEQVLNRLRKERKG